MAIEFFRKAADNLMGCFVIVFAQINKQGICIAINDPITFFLNEFTGKD